MHEDIVKFIDVFFKRSRTWFRAEGAVSKTATMRISSILQGCPVSMMVAAAAMTMYAHHAHATVPGCEHGTFVDDRISWRVGDGCGLTVGDFVCD